MNYGMPMSQMRPQAGTPTFDFRYPDRGVNAGSDAIMRLLGQMSARPTLMDTTSTTSGTVTQRGNESPELQALADQFLATVNQLSRNTTGAYQNKQNTYADLVKSLSDMWGSRGSGAANAASLSALSSGLTPLEASGAGNEQWLGALRQYFPQLSGLKSEAADVGIANQSALAGLQQNLWLPFLENVLSPYYQSLAGTTQETSSTTRGSTPVDQSNAMAQLAIELQRGGLTQQEQAQSAYEFTQNQMAAQAAAEEDRRRFGITSEQTNRELGIRQYAVDAQLAASERQYQASVMQIQEEAQAAARSAGIDLAKMDQQMNQWQQEYSTATNQADREFSFRQMQDARDFTARYGSQQQRDAVANAPDYGDLTSMMDTVNTGQNIMGAGLNTALGGFGGAMGLGGMFTPTPNNPLGQLAMMFNSGNAGGGVA